MRMTSSLAAAALCVGLATAGTAQAQMYWRLDMGFSETMEADFADKNFALDGAICADAACTSGGKLQEIDSSFVGGFGIGYRFSPSLRGDVTLSYRGGYHLSGMDAIGTQFSADMKSTALMVNGYWDFTMANKWMPFVGVGVGVSQNKIKPLTLTNSGVVFGLPGGSTNDTAVALMAGIAFPMASFVWEFGYRYVDLGKIETEQGNLTFGGAAIATYSGATGNVRAHEFTMSLRF